MTRDEIIKLLLTSPGVKVRHSSFNNSEYIYSDADGLIHDESDRIFEDWTTDIRDGLRCRNGESWTDGWYVIENEINITEWGIPEKITDACGKEVVAILTIGGTTHSPILMCDSCLNNLKKEIDNFEYRRRYK